MKSYPYRISDYYVILITTDANFSNAFLDYSISRYGPRNRKGFAKVFAVQNFAEALLLFHLENGRYVVVIDGSMENDEMHSFLAQVQAKLTQQLIHLYEPKELEMDKRLIDRQISVFLREIFLVILDDTIELPANNRFSEDAHVWHLQKPVTLEEIDAIISPAHMAVEAQWLRDSITYLPSGPLIYKKMEEIANSAYQTSSFVKVVGFGPGAENPYSNISRAGVLHFLADIIEQSVEKHEGSKGWIGHAYGFNFFIVVEKEHLKPVIQQIQFLFEKGIQDFYSPAQAAQLSMVFSSQYQ